MTEGAFALRSERKDETPRDWILEKVSVAAAYHGERLPIFLYVPKGAEPPYQTVVFFPGTNAFMSKHEQPEADSFDFIVRSGRVVVFPVYKGAMERNDEETAQSRLQWTSRDFTDYMVKVVQDFQRTLEYLEARADIDASKIGYYEVSEGGIWAPLLLAVARDRIRSCVLRLGGFYDEEFNPQIDPLNYVTRVKVPTLMLNGRYDTNLTLEEEVRPMFMRLGVPAEDKELKLFESDHFIPKSDLVRETLAWFDEYLGVVR